MTKYTEELYQIALTIATKAHKGQKRKFSEDAGKDYIIHPIRVAENFQGIAKVIGVVDDVLEDTTITEQDLLDAGIPVDVVMCVKWLSRNEDETYFDFIMRICMFCLSEPG